MWQVAKSQLFQKHETALIETDYEEFLFHDVPLLFSGRNHFQDRIVGSYVETQGNEQIYLHSIVGEKTYSRFENQLLAYRDLLSQAKFIFLVKVGSANDISVYWINYAEIPADYLPSETAMCPAPSHKKANIEIEARLVGGLADGHLVKPKTFGDFATNGEKWLGGLFTLPPFRRLIPNVFLTARNEQVLNWGSVKLNYHLELKEKQPTFFFDPHKYAEFIETYVAYCLHSLEKDAPFLAKNEIAELATFNTLLESYLEYFSQTAKREKEVRRFIMHLLKSAKLLGKFTEVVESDATSIEFSSLSEGGEVNDEINTIKQSLGVFDSSFATEMESSLIEVEAISGHAMKKAEDLEVFQIQIYDLNTNTRKGHATLAPDEEKKSARPVISISGEDGLDHTKYSASLHESKFIYVRAYATQDEKTIRKLDIEYDSAESYD